MNNVDNRISLKQIKEQAKKDGFENIRDWQKWKLKKRNDRVLYKKLKYVIIKKEQKKMQDNKKWFDELSERYGQDFANWAIQNRYKVRSPIISAGCKTELEYRNKIARDRGFDNIEEYRDNLAQKRGYKNCSEQTKVNMWKRGICGPFSDNEHCADYLGIDIAERQYARKILSSILGKIKEEMPPKYPGFDFVLDGDIKVDVKSARLIDKQWVYFINYNNIPDYFLILAFDGSIDKGDITLLHIWLIRKDDMVRHGNNYANLTKFYDRSSITITDSDKSLNKLLKYEKTNIKEKL